MALAKFNEYKPAELEASVLAQWESDELAAKLASHRQGAKKFFLLDGPPYVNALPHAGHVLTTVCKDVWTRWKGMQGFDTLAQPGFDCHGLPVEVMVEKDLGIKSKREILEMGVEKFDAACLQKILNNEKAWMAYYKQLGALRGFSEPYFTYKPYYIESVWWAFKQWHDAGLVSEGERSIHWCSHCETALAGYEVSDSYAMRNDPGIYVKFRVKASGKESGENEFLLVYTTTPWTLPSNVAIAVAAKEDYVKAKVGGEVLVVGKKLADHVLKEMGGTNYVVEREFKGAELEGVEYEPLIGCEGQKRLDGNPKARRVYLSIPLMARKKYRKHESGEEPEEEVEQFVTMAEGTGLVHAAPGHGLTDYLFGKHYGLPALSPIDEGGKFTADVGQWQGEYVKKADKKITEHLQAEGALFLEMQIQHSYPLCWRCKTPLLFRLSPQIYLGIAAVKEKMLAANRETHWMPPYGEDAFGNWVAGAQDWCISQQRFWGIPIPLWKCGSCGAKKVIGSAKELRANSSKPLGELDDLHRHIVDSIEFKCGECGGAMKRVQDIFNVWIDSGMAWAASLGYPHANAELFEKVFPIDVVCESQDQIRGWFYALSFTSFATLGKPAFKECSMMGWVVDEKGEKMSKSVGNVVAASEAIAKAGADALRLYFCSNIAPWEVHRYSHAGVLETQRSLNILFNSLKFQQMYGGGQQAGNSPEITGASTKGLRAEDRWLLSRLNSTAKKVNADNAQFAFHSAGRALLDFAVNDLSRWYIKLARDRVAVEAEDAADKAVCLSVLRHCLLETSKLFAPFTPFLSEYAYQTLAGKQGVSGRENAETDSVHLSDYPQGDDAFIDEGLERAMSIAMAVAEASNSLRQAAAVKLRWPLSELVVAGAPELQDEAGGGGAGGVLGLLKAQNNVLSATLVPEASDLPAGWPRKEIDLGGRKISVALNTQMTPELKRSALLRELVRAVQESRKQNKLVVTQRIALACSAQNAEDAAFLKDNIRLLAKEVGAASVEVVAVEKLAGEFTANAELAESKVTAKYSVRE